MKFKRSVVATGLVSLVLCACSGTDGNATDKIAVKIFPAP
jgi:hypothetical protein